MKNFDRKRNYSSDRSPLKILILEDVVSDAELLKLQLEDFEYDCDFRVTDKKEEYIRLLTEFGPDLVVSDFNLPRFNGLRALEILREQTDSIPFIFVTGTLGEENAVEAIRSGATDFIIKNRIEHFPASVLRALREKSERQSKKAVAKKLAYSEENYSKLFHLSPLPMWVYEMGTFKFLKVNQAAIKQYGYSEEEFLNLTVKDIRPREDILLVDHAVHTAKKSPDLYFRDTFRHKRKNGDIIHVEIQSTPVDFNGIAAKLVVANDLTEKIYAEEELKKSNQQLKTTQQIAKLGYWTHDLKTDRGNWSEEIYSIWEQDPLTFTPNFENFLNTVYPEDRHIFLTPMDESFPDEKFIETEHRILTPQNEIKWVYQKLNLIRDENWIPLRLEGVAQDITASKFKDEQVKISNDRFEKAMKATSEAIWDLDFEKNTLTWSEAFEEIFGHDSKTNDRDNSIWTKNIYTDDQQEVLNSFDAALANAEQEHWEMEYRFLRASGEIAYVVDRAFILRDDKGKAVRAVGAILDVTESRKRTEKIKDQNKTLREIAYTQSHVVRAPLASILGLLNILKYGPYDDLSSEEILEMVYSSAEKLDEVIKEVVKKASALKTMEEF